MTWTSRIVLAAAAAVIAGGALGGCSLGGGSGRPAPAAPTSAAPSGAGGIGAPAAPTSAAPTSAAPSAAPVLADGRWPVLFTQVDGTKASFDLIEFLTGDAAKKAWRKANPSAEEDGPPNDYMIVNDNKKIRTLPIAAGTKVKVVGADGVTTNVTITPAQLPKHFAGQEGYTHVMFWLTVKHGAVTGIQQQYLP